MKKSNQNGITLIALVITIIVLLILAGITINLTIGERGIITRAQEAGRNYVNAQEREEAGLNSFENEMDNIINDVTSGGSSTTKTTYSLGDEVTIGTEHFYVMKDSPENESTLTLLAKDCINTSLKQDVNSNNGNYIKFSETNYWKSETIYPYELNRGANNGKYDGNITDTSAIGLAKRYGASFGATGRFMTKAEADTLQTLNKDILYGINGKSSSTFLKYWLGSAEDASKAWGVSGGDSGFYYDFYSHTYGVRPVIEISKSLI